MAPRSNELVDHPRRRRFIQTHMKYRIVNGILAVLVEVYLAPCGFVAHWLTYDGKHLHEPFTPLLKK